MKARKGAKTLDVTAISQNWTKLQQELKLAPKSAEQNEEARLRKKEARKRQKLAAKQRKRATKELDNGDAQSPQLFCSSSQPVDGTEQKSTSNKNEGPLAIDCEFVGIGMEGADNMLARVSIVDSGNECVYDTHVQGDSPVVDYRTHVSGIRPGDLTGAPNFFEVQNRVRELIANRVLVGHGVHHDLQVLGISHPKSLIRDTSKFSLFRQMLNRNKTPSLKLLAKEILGVQVQKSEHDSIEDARVAMSLYQMYKKQWKSVEFGKRKMLKKKAAGRVEKTKKN